MYYEYLSNVRESHIDKFKFKLFYDIKYYTLGNYMQLNRTYQCYFQISPGFDINFQQV